MALERKGSPIVVPAIRVADLPALPADISDSAGMGKWWNDFRQVLARLIQSRSDTTQAQPPQSPAPVVEQPAAQEPKPVDWDSIINKPEKFPPIEHTHTTPWLQVEEPLSLSEIDPATNLATLGFHEQKAGHFLAGPLSGPVAKPVFRPLHSGDDGNLDDSGTGVGDGTPGTLDDLNGGTGAAPTAAALVQQRIGGSFSIVGCPPLNGVEASPPRRWLTQAWAGTNLEQNWAGNSTCGGAVTSWQAITLSGAATWSPASGLITSNTGLWARTGTAGSESHATTPGANLGLDSGIHGTRTTVATSDTWVRDGLCYDPAGDGTSSTRFTGGNSTTLSDECTEQRAIDAQGIGLEWYAADYARRTERTTLSFVAERLRYGVGTPGVGDAMIATDGWTPWGIYEIRVSIQQRQIDGAGELTAGSEWTEAAEIVHRIQAALDGTAKLDWQEAPDPPRGYAIRAVLSTPIAPITS